MKHKAELTTHIIHQLNFEFIYIFSEAMSKLASLSKPKPYLPMHLYSLSQYTLRIISVLQCHIRMSCVLRIEFRNNMENHTYSAVSAGWL